MANRTSCSAGRTTLIDPNAFDGQSSSSNIPVQHEDLTIYVELTTNKKARTILTTNVDTNTSTSQSSAGVTINFIEGSDFGDGKKYLSTKFTELTTAFEGDNEQENLGITNIDIDFNSSFAPMITIQFVDVRGSAIFQNENNVGTNKNKYSVLFQLPYPLYKLKIKGYYGQMVEYCLHMVKFNSKFNSKSGNFEITAQFVGYTYAMLSDMLVGYLRGISETTYGRQRYDELKKEDPNIKTLDELYKAISEINVKTTKILQTSADYKDLKNNNDAVEKLEEIKLQLNSTGKLLDINPNLNKYIYYIIDYDKYLANIDSNSSIVNGANESIKNLVGQYNGIKQNSLLNFDNDLQINIGSDTTIKSVKQRVFSDEQSTDGLPNRAVSISEDKKIYFVDNRKKFEILDTKIGDLNSDSENKRKKIGEDLRQSIKNELGFDPTVRNIFYVLTTSVEVFLYVLYRVSKEAGAIDNNIRKNELKRVFDKSNITDITDIKSRNSEYYPWPDYREYINDVGYVSEYLGKAVNSDNVDELRFIDDLLLGLVRSAQNRQNIENAISQTTSNWIPSNPFDTRLTGVENFPYTRVSADANDVNRLIAYILIRSTTFLSVTNRFLTNDEISSMAKIECNAMYNDFPNKSITTALGVLNRDSYLISSFDNNGTKIQILKKDNNQYLYDYYKINNRYYIPIKDRILQSSNSNNDYTPTQLSRDTSPYDVFLSNYYSTPNFNKFDDGAYYVSFYTVDQYQSEVKSLQEPLNLLTNPNVQDVIINYESLKNTEIKSSSDLKNIGFQCFSGQYGIQEYNNINWGTDIYGNLNYAYVFYSEDKFSSDDNGFSKKIDKNKYAKYIFDENTSSFQVYNPGSLKRETIKNTRSSLNEYKNENSDLTYSDISFKVQQFRAVGTGPTGQYSLFGSRFYYSQNSDESKALLFLHTIPFTGLDKKLNDGGIFNVTEIYNTFAYRGGFVYVPKLWVAFIGGMMWRYEQQTDPIKFFDVNSNFKKSFFPAINNDTGFLYEQYPFQTKNQYLISRIDTFSTLQISPSDYSLEFDKTFVYLPQQVKNSFINVFKNFVSNEWKNIKNSLEIFDGDGEQWCQTWENSFLNTPLINDSDTNEKKISTSIIKQNYKNYFNYDIISPTICKGLLCTGDIGPEHELFLLIKSDSQIVKDIVSLMNEQIVMANGTWRIWDKDGLTNYGSDESNSFPIIVYDNDINTYLDNFVSQSSVEKQNNNVFTQEQQIKQQTFGTSNEDTIKLGLYKTCKNIYDKWIGDVTLGEEDGQNIIFQCGARSVVDQELAKKRIGNDNAKLRFIDNFRFVTRSFRDIGDEMAINPMPINEYLSSNQNSSFYDLSTYLLSSNNFDFVPLPNFINYRDPNLLDSVFKPFPASTFKIDGQSGNNCGPTFVCVYVGERSKNLDFGDLNYPNDGFDINCDENGNLTPGVPDDFITNNNPYEDKVTFFKVSYGQQNQNIFKDITLDQSEFSETAESLKIIDDISTKSSETNRTLAGQNIYNVYSIRSYKAEVEMMGNAMIQPMMYFQLNNIPMFHGAYMITRVKHSITPNHMSTNFTGVRIRKADTKIVTSGDFYSSLLNSFGVVETTNAQSTTNNPQIGPNAFPDQAASAAGFIYPFDHGGKVSVRSSIGPRDGSFHDGLDYSISDGTNLLAIADGTISLLRLQNENGSSKGYGLFFVIDHGLIGNKYYKSVYGHVSQLNKAIFGYNVQDFENDTVLFNKVLGFDYNPNIFVKRGTVLGLSGGIKEKNIIKGYDLAGKSTGAHLHFELRIDSVNKTYTNMPSVDPTPYFPVVNLRYTKDGVDKDYYQQFPNSKPVNASQSNENPQGTIADFWTLVSICSLEAGIPQARADVAQSIYNRFYTPNQPYGITIKNIIINKGQYTPVSRNYNDWVAISDAQTAIKAVKGSKPEWDETRVKKELQDTINSIKDRQLIENAKRFVETRTEFKSYCEGDSPVEREPKNQNNCFSWQYAGKVLKGQQARSIDWGNINTNMV